MPNRLSGRVAVGPGVIAGSRVVVTAHAIPSATLPHGAEPRTAIVSADGSFVVEVPCPGESTRFELESDILWLQWAEVRAGIDQVVLYPELRAVVQCTLRPSALVGAAGVDLSSADVRCGPTADLGPSDAGPLSLWSTGEEIADGVLQFSLLPPGKEMTIQWRADDAVGLLSLPPLRPGERRNVDLVLGAYGALRGTVTDEQANPVRAEVRARFLAEGAFVEDVTTYTGEDGAFLFPKLVPGQWHLEVTASGLDRAVTPEPRGDIEMHVTLPQHR